MIPASTTPVAIAEDHGQRMDGHRPAHDERLQHVPLQLLHPDHGGEHDQRDDRPLVDQRDQHRHRAGQGGARRSG